MSMNSENLIHELKNKTEAIIIFVESLKSLTDSDLSKRTDENSWNVLECLQHLNFYGDFYLKEISNKMMHNQIPKEENFKSGILGNYFAKSMLPKENLKKIKTFKSMNPIHLQIDKNVIDVFLQQQAEILYLLEEAKCKNLTKIKTNISINKSIKIRLGDTFQFIINHNLRHIQQIKNILDI